MQPRHGICHGRVQLAGGAGRPRCRRRTLHRAGWRHVGGRLGQIRYGLGGRMIAPRAGGVEIGGERGADLLRDRLAAELGGPLLVECLHHVEHDEHGIDRLPAARLIVEQAELRGQGVGFADVGVDAARVVLEEAAVLGERLAVSRSAVWRNSSTRWTRSCSTNLLPRTSATSPAAIRRIMSICQRRSCAAT